MARFEFKTHFNAEAQTIEAYDYEMNTKDGNLTFTDDNGDKVASFQIMNGAYVKRKS